ncbi:MAG: YciI family protein [Burkholderiales bacterium]|jgi:uncharacterized protein YciI
MFIIDLNYKVDLAIVDQHLAAHRNWLEAYYQQGLLLCSGSKNPRTGGVIVALIKDRDQVKQLINQDPFYIKQIAEYTITEFNPVKYHNQVKDLI